METSLIPENATQILIIARPNASTIFVHRCMSDAREQRGRLGDRGDGDL